MRLAKKLVHKKCPECGKDWLPTQTILDKCSICERREFIIKLPVPEQMALVRAVVRERYQHAKLTHLSQKLQERLLAVQNEGAYIWGATGVGKTYALAALSRYFTLHGFRVARVGYERLCQIIRDCYSTNKSEWQTLLPFLTADKLILEDISTASSIGRQETDFSRRVITLVLDERCEDCLPTFITGNKSVKQLTTAFDERLVSRLHLGALIHLTGKDRRKK